MPKHGYVSKAAPRRWRSAREESGVDLKKRVEQIDRAFSGTLGVAAFNLTTGEEFHHQSDLSFYPASTVKLPVLYAIFKGALEGRWRLEDPLTLTPENMVEGSGILQDLTPGLVLSVRDAATLMIVVSDNTATNMLLDLCPPAEVNRSLSELGIHEVRLHRKIGTASARPLGEATPAGMARLMALIATGQVLTPGACSEMLRILERQQYKELTSRYIPETDAEGGPPPVRIASKSGWVRGVRNDVAVIWAPRSTYILSMFSQGCRDRRYYHDNEGSIALACVSQAVFEAWGR